MTTPPQAATARRLALGAYGERLAARHLVEQGMVVLDRNWRCSAGEIDLVLRDADVLVVCEVKTRSSSVCGSPHEAITPAKLDRLRRLADRWIRSTPSIRPTSGSTWSPCCCPRGGPCEVDHVRGLV